MKLSGDVYSSGVSIVYNDAPAAGLASQQEHQEFEKRIAAEGWRQVSHSGHREEWSTLYELSIPAPSPPPGPFACTGSLPGKMTGPIAVHGDLLAAGVPEENRVQIFHHREGRWTPTASLAVETRFCNFRFGAALALHQDTLAINGWAGNNAVTFLFTRQPNGEWSLSARILQEVRNLSPVLALTAGWLFLGTGAEYQSQGEVAVYRCVDGFWDYFGTLQRQHLPENANFGAALAALPGRLLVTSHNPGAVHSYTFQGQSWQRESTWALPSLVHGHTLAASNDTFALGHPSQYGASGRVDIYLGDPSEPHLAQTLSAPQPLFDHRFGSSLAFSHSDLLIANHTSVLVYSRSPVT